MRSFLLIVLSIFVLGFGFGVYWIMQGTHAPQAPRGDQVATRGPATMPRQGDPFVAPGEDVYWETFDPETGQRKSRIRADRYQELSDGRWLVARPEADFFLRDGQVLRISGQTGYLAMEQGPLKAGPNLSGNVNRTPRSGDLHNVTLTIHPSLGAPATLTLQMNNASFDNETFRIATEAYREHGKLIPADQVPVTARGDDYEFDGRGLNLQYNDLERRLEHLTVMHGQRLLIKHPGKFMSGAGNRPATQPAQSFLWPDERPIPGVFLAAADPSAVGEAIRGARRPRRPTTRPAEGSEPQREAPVYRATFDRDVVVLQGGEKLASARQLQIEFLGEETDEMGAMGLGPSTAAAGEGVRREAGPATRPARPRRQRPRAERPAATRPAIAAPTAPPSTAPATQSEQPIEIRWNGPLTIVPLPGDRPERIAPGESIVRMLAAPGKPVEVVRTENQDTHVMRCAALTHWTLDNGLLLEESPGIPVEIADSRGTHVLTHSLLFSQADGTALLTGQSRAILPLLDDVAAKKAGKQELMNVQWTDRCILYLEGSDLEKMVLERADLTGGVVVDHPDVKMNAAMLQLYFGPQAEQPAGRSAPTTQPRRSTPPLRQMDANGQVKCTIRGDAGPEDVRRVNCDSLRLVTDRADDGRLYARNIVAIGQVHTADKDGELRAGYVHVAMAPPATQPSTRPANDQFNAGDLQTLVAHDNVRVVTADGKTASASQLTVEMVDQHPVLTLVGDNARVTHEKSVLTGPFISMIPSRQQLTVSGAGQLDGMMSRNANEKPRPVRVTWTKSMRADGKDNLIECFGNVTAKTWEEDGTENTTVGDRVRIVTRPTTRPATQPATQPAAAAQKAKKPTTRPVDFDVMADKSIRSIQIEDGAQVDSLLMEGQRILSLFHLTSRSIQYDHENGQLIIPQAGQLLYVDDRKPTTQPTASTQPAQKDSMSIKGQTAFSWSRSLVYDEKARQMTMTGDVVVARQTRPGENVEPLRLEAQRIVADLEEGPQTQPATRPSMDTFSANARFRKVRADGGIHVTSARLDLRAEEMEYDQPHHLLTLRGTDRRPVRQFDSNGLEMLTASELVLDTESELIVSSKDLVARSRK